MVLHIARDIKDVGRFKKILRVLVEEGLAYYITKSKLHLHLPLHKRGTFQKEISDKCKQAKAIRHAFEKLGPTFVKLGQLLSLRPDLVPKEYVVEFEKLQDKVPSFPFTQVQKIIEEELGKPVTKLFKDFNHTPIACASIAQVHNATLKTGEKVAVKVQRPNITKIIDEDLDILFFLAHELEKHFENLQNYRPVEVVKEFALWTRRELDFRKEANNMTQIAKLLKRNKKVKIPLVYQKYSCSKILTMELVEGVKIDDLDSLQKMKIDRNTLVTTYFTSVLEQALLHGFFHADPHPANIFVQKNGTLVFLDFGIVGELSLSDRRKVLKFIDSIPVGDAQKSFDIALSLARWHEGADVQEFKREVLPLLLQVYNHDLSKGSLGHVLYKIMSLGSEYGVMFDPNHLLMAKAVYQAEGLAMKLDPHFKVNEALKVFMKDYFIQEYSPKQLVKRVKKSLWETKSLLMDLPDHIVKIIDRLEKQPKNTSAISQKQLTELESKLDRFSRRSTIEIIITLLLILGFVLLYLEGETHPFGIPLSVFVFVVIVGIIVYVYLKQKRK